MKNNKLWIILSCVFGLAAAAFIALTVINLMPRAEKKPAAPVQYELNENVNLHKIGDSLTSLVSNNFKSAKFPEGILDSMKQAYSVNPNLVGWLTIPGTEVDTAVLQSDDNDKYLKRDFYENWTGELSGRLYGNLFLDYRCIGDGELSKNMIIHGHTTGKSDGIPKQSFRSLYDYRKKEHFIKNPIIKYSTLKYQYVYKIYAVFYDSVNPKDDNGYFFNYIYPDMSDNNMKGYIEQVDQRALYKTGVGLEPTDKIITLSTCIYDLGKSVETRLVVVGRLLRDGESAEIDSSLVKDNPDYRRPQVWYTRNGKTNPYKDSARWQPSPD